jgi:3-oxoacyl-[acyl-carrier protein] reductase
MSFMTFIRLHGELFFISLIPFIAHTQPAYDAPMDNPLDLTHRVALVTGASSGIGAATAELLAGLGARVALSYHANVNGAAETRQRIVDAGGEAVAFQADVRTVAGVRALVTQATDALGPIDILVNNAGSLVKRFPIRDLTEAGWDEILTLNLKSAVFAAQAVASSMIERKRGAIVNVGSVAGHNGGGPGAGPYAAAKAGLAAFTKSLAKELAPHGIRANAVAPGIIDTPFHEMFTTPEMMRNFVNMIPIGRVGRPSECATAIAFLASDAASYITGEMIEINGGLSMR